MDDITNIEINLFDKRTLITNCTVEILENTTTGDMSIGWYRTDESEEIED